MYGAQWIVATVSHALQVDGDAAVSFGVLTRAEAAEDFLLDLAQAQIAFRAIIRKRDMKVAGEEQYHDLVRPEPPPEIMCIGFGDSTAPAVLPRRDRRQFPLSPGQSDTGDSA